LGHAGPGVSGASFTQGHTAGQKVGFADSACTTVKFHVGQEKEHAMGRKKMSIY